MRILTLCVLTLIIFSLTVGMIIQVITIDLKYARQNYCKARGLNLLIWMVVVAVLVNGPMFYATYKALLE